MTDSLTPAQTTILQLLIDGHTIKQIAYIRGIKRRTVWLYLEEARRKMGAATNFQLVAIFSARSEDNDREAVDE